MGTVIQTGDHNLQVNTDVKQVEPQKCLSGRTLIIMGLALSVIATTIGVLALHYGWAAATPGAILVGISAVSATTFLALLVSSYCCNPDKNNTTDVDPFSGQGHRLNGEDDTADGGCRASSSGTTTTGPTATPNSQSAADSTTDYN